MNNYFSKSSSGFTLMELLVVIAIVGILSAVAMPSFVSTIQRFRVMSSMSAFAGDLQYARTEALKQGLSVVMCPSSNGTSCTSANTWQIGWMVYALQTTGSASKTILRVQSAWTNTDTLVSANVSAPYTLTFSREGYVSGLTGTTSATFTINTTPANTAVIKCVSLNKAGRQLVQTGSCTS
jgi:type IV fimbrial biogenesis protein FimT